jgi:short-subunit dehydrogenase
MKKIIIHLLIIAIFLKIMWKLQTILRQYFCMRRKDLLKRYGVSYVMITGASRGQGRQFALQFAKLGFHLILLGSNNTIQVKEEISLLYPKCQVELCILDFGDLYKPRYFYELISPYLETKNISIVVNNVGYRTGASDYSTLPDEEIMKCIVVGTMTQSLLIKYILPHFAKREEQGHHSAIINITSQCQHSTDLFAFEPTISIPYLNVYEACNAYGFYHSNSIHKELLLKYRYLDYLTITPGAVLTDSTEPFLNSVWWCSIHDDEYVSNILNLLGNKQGIQCASLLHSVSDICINLIPWLKPYILESIGHRIASHYEYKYKHK